VCLFLREGTHSSRGEALRGGGRRIRARREKSASAAPRSTLTPFSFSLLPSCPPFLPAVSLLSSCVYLFIFPQGCALTLRTRACRSRYETIYYRAASAKADDDDERGSPTGEIAITGFGFVHLRGRESRQGRLRAFSGGLVWQSSR